MERVRPGNTGRVRQHAGGTLLVGVDDGGQVAGWPGRESDFRTSCNQIVDALVGLGLIERTGTTGRGTYYVLKEHDRGKRGVQGASGAQHQCREAQRQAQEGGPRLNAAANRTTDCPRSPSGRLKPCHNCTHG